MSSFLKEKHIFVHLKWHQIDQKYSVDIVNVVNDYCSWKQLIFKNLLGLGHFFLHFLPEWRAQSKLPVAQALKPGYAYNWYHKKTLWIL